MICCIFEHNPKVEIWIKKIKDVRNKVFHLPDPFTISKEQFDRFLYYLSGSVGGIARMFGTESYEDLEFKEKSVLSSKITYANLLNAQQFLKEEFQRKYEELQLKRTSQLNNLVKCMDTSSTKKQIQHLFKTSADVRSALHKVEISVSGNSGVSRLINTSDDSKLSDMQTVPVLFVFDVPKDWNKDEIANEIEKIIKIHNTGHREVRIKEITIGDLNIIVEIVRRVLRNIDDLEFEIAKLVSNFLASPTIDITRDDKVYINMFAQAEIHGQYAQNDSRYLKKEGREYAGAQFAVRT